MKIHRDEFWLKSQYLLLSLSLKLATDRILRRVIPIKADRINYHSLELC